MLSDKEHSRFAFLRKNAIWILLLLLGMVLMLFPSRRVKEESLSLTENEIRLRETLVKMEGVGEAYVLLAEKEGREGGFTGAVIVCEGALVPSVRLRVIRAVSAFTGLGSDKILVQKMIS